VPETTEKIAAHQASDRSESEGLSPLDMPSATTIVFTLIVLMSLILVTPPVSSSSAPSVCGLGIWLPLIGVLLIALKLYLSSPDRIIEQNQMRPLGDLDPELVKQTDLFAEALGLAHHPTLLYTEKPGLPIQAFGSFRRHFIVLNKSELTAAKEQNASMALQTMLVHELAHFKTGDIWKLQFAKQITRAVFVYSGIIALMGLGTSYALKILLLGSVGKRGDLIATVALFPFIMGIMVYALYLLEQIREYYADAWTERLLGKDNVVMALLKASEFSPKRAMDKDWSLSFPPAQRVRVIQEHKSFLQTMRRVLFVGGLVLGSQVFSLMDGGLQILFIGNALGGTFLGVSYLLPHLTESTKAPIKSFKHVFVAASTFTAGILSFMLLRTAIQFIISTLSGVYPPIVIAQLQINLWLSLSVLVSGLILALGLVSTTRIIHWCYAGMKANVIPEKWGFGLMMIPLAQSAVMVVITNAIIYFLIVLLFFKFAITQAFNLLWPLLIILPFYICMMGLFKRIFSSQARFETASFETAS
jgi:Zn-dependent protease with chaperone function